MKNNVQRRRIAAASGHRDKKRLRFFLGFTALIVLLIVGKLVYLMILTPSGGNPDSITLPVVERGPILDRNGRILAISSRLESVSAWIPDLKDPETVARELAPILDLDPEEDILPRLESHSGFVYIKRKITPTQAEKVRALMSADGLPGISLTPEFGRNYPEQTLACHVLGYVGTDNIGLEGVEYSFNNELSPPAVGQDLKEVFGNQLFLTLDVNIQYMVEEIAKESYEANQADSVTILVMDAQSGEILGYAGIPGFDPNEYNRYENRFLQNLPLTHAYEPGSVFKIVSLSSILELGGVSEDDEFYCGGVFERTLADGQSIRITDLRAHGRVTPSLIIKYSCNVGAAQASERVDRDSFYQMLQRFGFGKPTGLPLPGESAGILAAPERWSARSKATIAFGQEISVSALQMITAATAIANNGLLLKPLIVGKIVSPQGEVVSTFRRTPVREVLNPDTARAMLLMMETAVQAEGTARRGAVDGVRVSAKTGTAQVADPNTGAYSEKDFVASYLAIFPTNDPRLIVYVVIDRPKGPQFYGSQIAAPVFKQLAERLIDYLGIPREGDTVLRQSGEVRLILPAPVAIGERMPDLTGTPKRLLLPLFAQENLVLKISGEGYVSRQSPPPGTPISEGMVITLELE
jgi:cell division protein FtsI (penicillin-binding protein 3)